MSWQNVARVLDAYGALEQRLYKVAPCSEEHDYETHTINGYLTRYGLKDWAIGRYKGMAVEPNACIECGMCESRCPYHLPIIEMLKDVYSNFQKEIK